MSRPRKYDDSAILEAAAAVFLEQGSGASTASVAERAGVSEGILFKRFKTKEGLFAAAMAAGPGSHQWRNDLLESVGQGTPRDNLKVAILALLRELAKFIPKLMVLEGQGRHHLLRGPKAPPIEDAAAIANYLKQEVKAGRLQMDCFELHSHEIVGAVVHYTVLTHRHQTKVCSPSRLTEHLLDVHVGPPKAATPKRRSSK